MHIPDLTVGHVLLLIHAHPCHVVDEIEMLYKTYGIKKIFIADDTFTAKSLADAVAQGTYFDMIYLDIEMDKEDGISAAKRIREYDKNTLIIYVTSHENHMQESFEVRPFRFLVKPVSEKQIESCFKSAYEEVYCEDSYFRYSYQRVNHKIPMREILYFESNKRKVFIVTEKGTFVAYAKLNDIEESLKQSKVPFLRVHQSYLVNYKHNMKNNLVSILAYAENGDNEKIIRFVNEIMEEGGIKTSTVTNSGNIVIDSLIGYWYVEAKKVGIDFSVNLNIPMEMPFRGADICLILGNLLENAVEAAQKAEGKKYIRFHMKYDKNNLLLFVENNYKGVLIKTKDKRLKSTKTDAGNHGVGLSSVYRIAAKYHGVVTIDDDVANRFLIRVVLYGKQE